MPHLFPQTNTNKYKQIQTIYPLIPGIFVTIKENNSTCHHHFQVCPSSPCPSLHAFPAPFAPNPCSAYSNWNPRAPTPSMIMIGLPRYPLSSMGNIEWIIDSKYNQTWLKCLLSYPISSNLSNWILATTAFDNEAGCQLTKAYYVSIPDPPPRIPQISLTPVS